MRKILTYTVISVTMTLLASTSYATPIIGTMTATLDYIDGTEANADWTTGDTISISFLFDNAGTEFTQFNDGSNGIGEFGANDDTVNLVSSISDTGFAYQSDTDVSLPSAIAGYADDYDNYFVNSSYVYSSPTTLNIDMGLRLYTDGLDILMNDVSDSSSRSNSLRITWGEYTFFGVENTLASDEVSFSYREASAPVPEPTTMILFGTGLAGLVGVRLKRNS